MAPIETPTEPRARATAAVGGSGPQTVGEHLLAVSRRHSGVALQYARDGVPAYISYPELGTISSEIARGLISLGVAMRRPRRDPRADLGPVDARRLRIAVCRRGGRADLPHQLADQSAPMCSRTPERGSPFCENAAQAAKIEQVRDRCPALEHVVLFEDDGRTLLTLDGLRQLGSEVPPDSVQQRLASMHRMISRRSSTRPAPPAPRKAACSAITISWRPRGCTSSSSASTTATRLYQFLPLAHVLARVAQIVALERRRPHHLLERDPAADRRRAAADLAHPLPGCPAHLREDPQRGDRTRPTRARARSASCSTGRCDAANAHGPRSATASSRTCSPTSNTGSPIRWCSPRCAPRSVRRSSSG